MGGDLDASRLGWLNAKDQKQQAAIAAAVAVVAARPVPTALPAEQSAKAKAAVPKKSDEDLAEEREEKATARLKNAKALRAKNASAADKRLREIVTEFPGTKAAAEAAKLLEK